MDKARHTPARFIVIATVILGAAQTRAEDVPTTTPVVDIDGLVQQYFMEKDTSKRKEIGVTIEAREGVTIERVVAGLGRLNVWESRAAGAADFTYVNAAGAQKTVRMIVPEGYDPGRRYPLVVGLYDGPEGEAEVFMTSVTTGIDPALIALPRHFTGGGFASGPVAALEPVDLLREIRLRYHVDTDRVYVLSTGGENGAAAINLALFYTHWITGVIALGPEPDAPYPRQAYPFLLENLAHTPLFLARLNRPASQPASRPVDAREVPDPLEVMQAVALREQFPLTVRPIQELPRSPGAAWWQELSNTLTTRKEAGGRDLAHWFRYPVQGRVGWLRQERFDGEPWEASLITILSAPSTDFHAYATQVLQGKLAYIGGRIDGQHIEITTERTDRVELRLHDGLLDLGQPVEIDWAGRTHATVKVTPRISTVLETAHEDWDFQHPVSVRLIAYRDGTLQQR